MTSEKKETYWVIKLWSREKTRCHEIRRRFETEESAMEYFQKEYEPGQRGIISRIESTECDIRNVKLYSVLKEDTELTK